MREVYRLRDNLLYTTLNSVNCEMVVGSVITSVLSNIPSYTLIMRCPNEDCNKTVERISPLLGLHVNVFDNNISNIHGAIFANFSANYSMTCGPCNKLLTASIRFGNHLFIEVFESLNHH